MAQQNDGPILRPNKPMAKQEGPTLLVLCDLACDWKLDGEAKGHIDAGGSARAKVELGQHFVVALTDDGLDRYETELNMNSIEQTIVRAKLAPIRSTRLQKEELARKEDEIARNAAEQDKKDKDELAKGYWVDTGTGLMWTKVDSSIRKGAGDSTGLLNWDEAVDYCRRLQLGDHKDWRLPTIEELEGIYDPKLLVPGLDKPAIKGNLRVSIDHWSTTPSQYPGMVLIFDFYNGMRGDNFMSSEGQYAYVLCVRRSRE